jgi:hypothetical protein
MAEVKHKKKGLKSENLGELQKFNEKLKKGEIFPFKEKTQQAHRDLKDAGLIG